MSLLRINASGDRIDTQACTQAGGLAGLGGTVTIMVHGFKFSPSRAGRSPHDHIFAETARPPSPKALSWPRQLGLNSSGAAARVGIAFGWEASGSIWKAYQEASRAGLALADLVRQLTRDGKGAGRDVNIVAHSLGARVVLQALHHLPAGAVQRVVLMAPAELQSPARAALDSPAAQSARFLGVTSRENDLFDLLLERLIAPHRPGERALGHRLNAPRAQWLNLEIDNAAALAALSALGYPVAPPRRRICHWSTYLRPGIFGVYDAYLSGALPHERLMQALPERPARRWSRLFAPPAAIAALPGVGSVAP